MKVICGNWRRMKFIQDYINKNKNKEIMIVDITGDKLYKLMENVECRYFESGDGNIEEVILELEEFPYKIDEIILLTNESIEQAKYFKMKFKDLSNDVTISLLSNTGVRVDTHIMEI
ncbi:hypothetical protein GCM10008916_12870 [Clostridium nitritogenes]|uniref:Uncharacterized protein n=1 Tax=Clostridium nitritogenes TaxID=83340 RepID=A0ABP3WWZ7_9CLOT